MWFRLFLCFNAATVGSYAFISPRQFRTSSSASLFPAIGNENAVDTSLHVWSREQVEDFADKEGVVLSISTLGPGYRAIARAKHNTTLILGYVEGFIRPQGSLLHLDKMEVFRKIVKQVRSENNDFRGGGTPIGVGLLLGYLCALHGRENGCKDAEFLAIDDEDKQHERLVRYYKTAGFRVIRYVGDGVRDIPDRLVWGGCGTLLRNDIPTLLDYWTNMLEKTVEKRGGAVSADA